MTAGRKLTWRKSEGFTPATLKATDSEKKAMPNDMANLGCRTVAQMGSTIPEAQACVFSHHETCGWVEGKGARRRSDAIPVVDARMFSTKPAAGSKSGSCSGQLRPASPSGHSGPPRDQVRPWSWDL